MASDISKELVAEARAELDSILERLGANGDDIKLAGADVAAMALDVAAAKLTGANTTVAEAALRASYLNLVAASSVTAASAALRFARTLLINIGEAVIRSAVT